MAYESTADVVGYGGAAGGGKGLALSTPIATPDGWTTIGDVHVGDVVFDEGGEPCQVTAVSDINHRPCFRLTFDDGSILVADDVHRWVTFDIKELAALTRRDPSWRASRRSKRPSRAKETTSPSRIAALAERNAQCVKPLLPPKGTMRDTLTLANTLQIGKRCNHAIRVSCALSLPDASLPVAPYTLGAWLGDGSSRNGQLTGEDSYIWERIESEGYEVRHYSWDDQAHSIIGLKAALRDLGVLNNKHIPLAYFRSSYAQRLALLQGLMDTDGHAAIDGGCEFDNTNEALAIGVRQLVATLGIKSTMQQGMAKLNGRCVGPKWRVKFTTSLPVFGMPRKAGRIKSTTRRTAKFRYLVACDPVDSVPTRCIAVDSDSRQYLAGDQLIPTHNTDLAIGIALTKHKRAAIFRREGTQLEGIIDRLETIIGNRDGYNGQKNTWRHNGLKIEFGSCPHPGDEKKYQGRPKDLLVIDEAANFLESQVRFLMGWVRTTDESQPCQTLLTFNPPTDNDGEWIVRFFAPWLDPMHINPAKPGEIRFFAMVDGEEREVDSKESFLHNGEIIKPQSRTFIPSKVMDNPFLVETGYIATLQALPEPLRSQMLRGDFMAGKQDNPWQVIPTAWVEAAQARWTEDGGKGRPMDSMGVDVARGGKDETVIAKRHGTWFARNDCYPGSDTPNGQIVVGYTLSKRKDDAPVHVDVIGVGASVYDQLDGNGIHAVAVQSAGKANDASGQPLRDKSKQLMFANYRAYIWWALREALDPETGEDLALPPGQKVKADLCAPRWKMTARGVQVESKEDIADPKRLGRSTNDGDAIVYANIRTPKRFDADDDEWEDRPWSHGERGAGGY